MKAPSDRRTLSNVVVAVGFVIFLAIALVEVRAVPARLTAIWPSVAGCISFGLVTAWKLV